MLLTFIVLFVLFIAIDYVWIGIVMKDFYLNLLQGIGRMENGAFKPHIPSMIAVYIAAAFLVTFFIYPMFQKEGITFHSVAMTFLFGIATYAFYDFTNYALLKDWPAKILAVDILWGGVLMALGTMFAYLILTKVF